MKPAPRTLYLLADLGPQQGLSTGHASAWASALSAQLARPATHGDVLQVVALHANETGAKSSELSDKLAEVAAQFADLGVDCRTQLVEGQLADSTIDLATGCVGVVVGRRSCESFAASVLGRHARWALEHLQAPIIVAPPNQATKRLDQVLVVVGSLEPDTPQVRQGQQIANDIGARATFVCPIQSGADSHRLCEVPTSGRPLGPDNVLSEGLDLATCILEAAKQLNVGALVLTGELNESAHRAESANNRIMRLSELPVWSWPTRRSAARTRHAQPLPYPTAT